MVFVVVDEVVDKVGAFADDEGGRESETTMAFTGRIWLFANRAEINAC